MPRTPSAAKPRKKAAARPGAAAPDAVPVPPAAARPAKAAVPAEAEERAVDEPVWLVRIVLVLFLVGFAAFLAREVYGFMQALG